MGFESNLLDMFADAVRKDEPLRIDAIGCAIASKLDPTMPFRELMQTKQFHDWAVLYAMTVAVHTTEPQPVELCAACARQADMDSVTLITRTAQDHTVEHFWECEHCGHFNASNYEE